MYRVIGWQITGMKRVIHKASNTSAHDNSSHVVNVWGHGTILCRYMVYDVQVHVYVRKREQRERKRQRASLRDNYTKSLFGLETYIFVLCLF